MKWSNFITFLWFYSELLTLAKANDFHTIKTTIQAPIRGKLQRTLEKVIRVLSK